MNTSIKQRVGCILLSILLVVCLIGSLLCALILPFMSSNGVASADSTIGVVGDNLLIDTFMDWNKSGVVSRAGDNLLGSLNFGTNIYLYNLADTTTSYTVDTFTNSGGVGFYNNRVWFDGEILTSGSTYTFTVCYTSDYACRLRVRNGDNNNVYTSWDETASSEERLLSLTFTYTGDAKPRYLIYFGGTLSIHYFKVEQGSSFTGYVPNDYTNYGYYQGYNEGVQDTNTKFNTLRGYSILSSPAHVLKYKYNQNGISNVYPGESLSATYMPIVNGDPPLLFTYNNVPYGFGDPISSLTPRPFYSYTADYSLRLTGQVIPSGYTTFQVGYNVSYDGTNLYFCKGSFVWDPSYRLVAQTVDTLQYIFLDQFVANVYFSNIAAMDLSSYLQSGQIYNFYIYKSSLETAWNLDTYNTFYTGINSICFVKVENTDVIGQSSYNEGRADGFEQGKLTGYYEGWADGYAQGELVAPADGQYTFLGVIGALFDAPVNSLKTFLDFDLLGFNMKSFVFAMLTLAFIVLIIRLILGSKS